MQNSHVRSRQFDVFDKHVLMFGFHSSVFLQPVVVKENRRPRIIRMNVFPSGSDLVILAHICLLAQGKAL